MTETATPVIRIVRTAPASVADGGRVHLGGFRAGL